MHAQANLKQRADQLQALGSIITLIEQIDLEDLAMIARGSYLGEVVNLLSEIKKIMVSQGKDRVNQDRASASKTGRKTSLASVAKMTQGTTQRGQKVFPQPAITAAITMNQTHLAVNKPVGGKPPGNADKAATIMQSNSILLDYLKQVFTDIELFPSRRSINEFFKDYFNIEYNLNKKSRTEVINRLCKLLLQKQLGRVAIADILLQATNSKYGSFLKEDDAIFLKGWQP